MDKKTEALKLALEALEESLGYVEEEAENAQRLYGQYPTRQARIQGLKDDARKHMNAITAIREALAEQPAQQQEPPTVAELLCVCGAEWEWRNRDWELVSTSPASKPWVGLTGVERIELMEKTHPKNRWPLLALCEEKLREKNAQPSKPWVGLTKEDRYKAIRPLYRDDATAALAACHSNDEYEAIEAKLREKNAQPSKPLKDEQIDRAIAELGLNYFADAANNRAVLRELCRKAAHAKGDA